MQKTSKAAKTNGTRIADDGQYVVRTDKSMRRQDVGKYHAMHGLVDDIAKAVRFTGVQVRRMAGRYALNCSFHRVG